MKEKSENIEIIATYRSPSVLNVNYF